MATRMLISDASSCALLTCASVEILSFEGNASCQVLSIQLTFTFRRKIFVFFFRRAGFVPSLQMLQPAVMRSDTYAASGGESGLDKAQFNIY